MVEGAGERIDLALERLTLHVGQFATERSIGALVQLRQPFDGSHCQRDDVVRNEAGLDCPPFLHAHDLRVCALLDELRPKADGTYYATQITYVTDRPGHDRRYAIDARKIERELGWKPAETFETGIRKTVEWYLANPDWVAHVQSGSYRDWVAKQYANEVQPA